MTVGNYDLSFLAIWWQRYQNILNRLVIVLLSVYLIAFAAELTWRLFPTDDSTAAIANQPDPVMGEQSASVDVAALQNLNLFGKPGAKVTEPVEQTDNAPKTTLKLILTGVVASSDTRQGAAIIENRGTQNTYGVGEKIDGTNALIREVRMDRVILRNGGRLETLLLDGVDGKAVARSSNPTRAVSQKGKGSRKRLSERSRNLTKTLSNSPAKFTDYIAIAPVRRGGTLIGYRVTPGKDASLFKEAGLINNDIITEINGLDLTDAQQSAEAIKALRSTESLQLTINRHDQFITIYLDLPESE